MKKLLVVLAILFVVSIVSYGQDPVKEDWEVVPGIISGGYSEETGPYIYKLCNTFTCPSLVYDRSWYSTIYLQGIAGNLGYGEFKHHGGGSLISSDNQGEITKADDGTWAVSYRHYYFTQHSEEAFPRYPLEFTGVYGPAYVYKKEFIQSLEARFTSENYVVGVGQVLNVGIEVTGGSGWETGTIGSKPAFLTITGGNAYSGVCYIPLTSSITAIVTDDITGQSCAISATITVTEQPVIPDPVDPIDPIDPIDPVDPNDPTDPSNPSNPSNPSDPTDPSDPSDPSNPSDPSGPSEPAEPSDPVDPSNPDTPDEPTDPTEPNDTTEPDSPDEPEDPTDPSDPDEPVVVPNGPIDPADPDDPDDPVVVVPDSPDDPDSPDFPDEPVVVVPDPDPIEPGSDDYEPIVVVIDDNDISDNDKIVVTNDGVTTERQDNHDLAIFLGMFGAITGISGSATAPVNAPMAVQQAQQESSSNKINYVE